MDIKLCLFCKHFSCTQESAHYGTMTGSDYWNEISCRKGHFNVNDYSTDLSETIDQQGHIIVMAEQCADYDESAFARRMRELKEAEK